MGNAGDLPKHGVLAEYVGWRRELGSPVRFIDLFGGEPGGKVEGEIKDRVLALPEESALRCAQTEIDRSWYLGSGLVACNAGARQVLTNDWDPGRRERLRAAGLGLVADVLSCPGEAHGWDSYRMLDDVVHDLRTDDLVLVDPLSSFLPGHAKEVMPFLAAAVKERQATVLIFALNLNPRNSVGRRFDTLLAEHLPGAWRITCPPHPELKYYADVVLAVPRAVAQSGPAVESLRRRLERFAKHLRAVLFPFEVQVVEAPGSNAGSQPRNRRVQALHRLFELFDGNDPAAEVRRLKLEDEGA